MIASNVPNRDLLKKETAVMERIPYRSFVTPNTIKTNEGDFVRIFSLGGIAHETADDDEINTWHRNLGMYYRNVGSPQTAIWTHLVRRQEGRYPEGEYPAGFAQQLDAAWRERCTSGVPMLVNEMYLSLVYRPATGKAGKVMRKLDNMSADARKEEREIALQELDQMEQMLMNSMQRYEPAALTLYEENGIVWSESARFISFLISGEDRATPAPRSDMRRALASKRPHFGSSSIAFTSPLGESYGAMMGIGEYTERTGPGIFNALLTVPFEFVLAQSFSFYAKPVAMDLMERQEQALLNSGDHSESQISELRDAMDELASNKWAGGEYHFSFLIKAETPDLLRENIGIATTEFGESGMKLVQEDIANEASFWSQLPGNFTLRPRPAFATSRNFAGFAPFHTFPAGRRERNHWGSAVALVRTTANSPYYFNFHRADVGNTLIIGPTGSGKTAAQAFFLSQLQKAKPVTVFIDKDKGAKIYVERMGGYYQDLRNNQKTGWNPFQMEENESNLAALESLLTIVGKPATPTEERQLSTALADVMRAPKKLRRMSLLLESLDRTQQDGLYYRIERWTSGQPLGWVFDSSATDCIDFQKHSMYGFDMTELLDNEVVRPAALFYLMHRMEDVIDGRRFCCFMDEFWKLLLDDIFEDFAQNKLKVIRKQNGFLVFGTQSPKDALRSPIAHTIIEQCPTLILLPAPRADRKDYIDGLHLTEREFWLVKEGMQERSGKMLVKQGSNSVVIDLNMRGMDNELAILSGNSVTVAILEEIKRQTGIEDPEAWEPLFHELRKLAKADNDKIDLIFRHMDEAIADANDKDPAAWLPLFRRARENYEQSLKAALDDAKARARRAA